MKSLLIILIALFCFGRVGISFALQAEEILLIANQNLPASIELAKYYSEKRQIPEGNLLTVDMTDQEDYSREEYQQK